jgi:cytoskeletal protein CcmA (bactofilin family)
VPRGAQGPVLFPREISDAMGKTALIHWRVADTHRSLPAVGFRFDEGIHSWSTEVFTKQPQKAVSSQPNPVKRDGAPRQTPASRLGRDAAGASGSATIIGVGLTIVGNVESKGDIQIEGEIHGDVHAIIRITVDEGARTSGALIAQEVLVRGSAQGSIRGNSVIFQSTSRVEGDVFHKSLVIELGAFFEGRSRRSQDPMSAQSTAGGEPSLS